MSDEEAFDAAGILLTPLRNGKFKAERIGIRDGKIVVIHQITSDRNLTWAHRAGGEDYAGLVTSINRGSIPLVVQDPITIKVDE